MDSFEVANKWFDLVAGSVREAFLESKNDPPYVIVTIVKPEGIVLLYPNTDIDYVASVLSEASGSIILGNANQEEKRLDLND